MSRGRDSRDFLVPSSLAARCVAGVRAQCKPGEYQDAEWPERRGASEDCAEQAWGDDVPLRSAVRDACTAAS